MSEQEIAQELRELRRNFYRKASEIVRRNFDSERITNNSRTSDFEKRLLGDNNNVVEGNIMNELKQLI